MALPIDISLHNILAFLQYLHENAISPKVIRNYISSVHAQAQFYGMNCEIMAHEAIARFLRSISINSKFSPTPRCVFDVHTLYRISLACDNLADPILYRAIFLTAFYGFFRMSNIAPHSASKFDPNYHFTRRDIIFGPPGIHMVIKWTKTLQHHRSHHIVQLPTIQNHFLCPVRALRALLTSRILPPSAPLFANNFSP